MKNFSFGTKTAQLKIEMLNLLNRPNVRALSGRNTFGNANFGQTNTQAGFMRITQVMFRFIVLGVPRSAGERVDFGHGDFLVSVAFFCSRSSNRWIAHRV